VLFSRFDTGEQEACGYLPTCPLETRPWFCGAFGPFFTYNVPLVQLNRDKPTENHFSRYVKL
jgi:hypothetical protein